ncbi:MAG: hypothetical protein J1E85_06200 [Ruminococcus sp.]|nr:hypothetical protein [Ruminococcus sp.]
MLPTFAISYSDKAIELNESSMDFYVEDKIIVESENQLLDDGVERLVIEEDVPAQSLATKYDPRQNNVLTDVKLQYSGTCWIYSAIACAEELYSLNYGVKQSFSEFHALNYLTYDLKFANGIYPFNDYKGFYNLDYETGGNFASAAQYMTNWNQPIISDNNISWNSMVDISAQSGISSSKNHTALSSINVTDIKYISKNQNIMKQYIRNYGAVYSYMYFDSRILASNSFESYCSSYGGDINHAICIVGWDDNYSKDNFLQDDTIHAECPSKDGAWLVRNSNCLENDGYFWLSYSEATLNYNYFPSVITGIEKADSNKLMLSYDFLPLSSYTRVAADYDDNAYFANIYDTSNISENYTTVTEVMTYLSSDGCNYNLYITEADDINDLPHSFDDLLPVAKGMYTGEGYITIHLDEPYEVNTGKSYAFIMEVIPTDVDNVTALMCEMNNPAYGVPEINRNESFYSLDINSDTPWKDKYDLSSSTGNFCIRPVLYKCDSSSYAELTPEIIYSIDEDIDININSNVELFCVRKDNMILRQDRDYTRDGKTITLKSSYLSSLGDKYTELKFEFNNDVTKTIVVNPKAKLTSASIEGFPLINNILTAKVEADIEKSSYDVTYQWQQSIDGKKWFDISGATDVTYTLTDNDFQRYIRVMVNSKDRYGNVEYPYTIYSDATETKAVYRGDANMDMKLTIDDVTIIQKYLAENATFNKEQILAADADRNSDIGIDDATTIQKVLADMITF